MRQTMQRSISTAAMFALVTMGLAMAAPKTERAGSEITVYGRVLKIDKKERTMLISDHSSKKLCLVTVPEGAQFKIIFGIYKCYEHPSLDNVYRTDLVRVRCIRTDGERLARLDDGQQAVVLTASR
jgi:hypothetical protein